jgi:hypothetical protein
MESFDATRDQRAVPHAHGRCYSHFFRLLNHLCADFLKSVAATDPYSLSNTNMGSDARGGITQSGAPGSYTYAFKANMGDKPVKGRKASGAGSRHLSPLIRPSPRARFVPEIPIRPRNPDSSQKSRFVPTHARFVPFRVLRDCALGHDAYNV